jgi:hypothetical protein
LAHFGAACLNVQRRATSTLYSLDDRLRGLVHRVVERMGGRVTPWTGFRDEEAQNRAWDKGFSNARWGQSPHNYQPALACDFALNPQRVNVRERIESFNAGWPDLWDNDTAEAQQAWADLHRVALSIGLGRVRIRKHGRESKQWDRPHVQLTDWKQRAGLVD